MEAVLAAEVVLVGLEEMYCCCYQPKLLQGRLKGHLDHRRSCCHDFVETAVELLAERKS